MNELQRARADWIEAQEKLLKLDKENSDLRQKVFALEMRLAVTECQRDITKGLYDGLARAVLTV